MLCRPGTARPAWDDSVITPAVKADKGLRHTGHFPVLELPDRPRQLKVRQLEGIPS